MEKTFQPSDKFEEAEIETKAIKYLYNNKGEYWFCEKDNPATRFKLEENVVGNSIDLIKANSLVNAKIFDEKIISIELPIKVELKVVEAPPIHQRKHRPRRKQTSESRNRRHDQHTPFRQ